ncbi:hypothetical protein [Bacillus sp. JJ722]|uniref:hypothetical protein n=1 Tax=Bacillus sp. JJ722 TaxID=3122973 RepID=UPI002FFF55A8
MKESISQVKESINYLKNDVNEFGKSLGAMQESINELQADFKEYQRSRLEEQIERKIMNKLLHEQYEAIITTLKKNTEQLDELVEKSRGDEVEHLRSVK